VVNGVRGIDRYFFNFGWMDGYMGCVWLESSGGSGCAIPCTFIKVYSLFCVMHIDTIQFLYLLI